MELSWRRTRSRRAVPPMLIQTLVENAIKHGISELPDGGVVRIEARRLDGRVEILVANTGQSAAAGARRVVAASTTRGNACG